MPKMIQRGAYPYPFLDSSEEVQSNFMIAGTPSITPGNSEVKIDLELTLSEDIRKELVERGTFATIAEWECSTTVQSGLLPIDVSRSVGDMVVVTFSIPLDHLVDRVKVAITMVSLVNLEAFKWPAQNEIYEDASFGISKGDRVGLAGKFSFDATRWFDPMVPPIESCIEFVHDLRIKDGFSVDLTGDVIKVMLPHQLYNGFVLQANRPLVQQTVILVPALMHAINEMSANPDDISDRGWFKSLHQIIGAKNLEGLKPLEIVQELLDHPAKGLLLEDMNLEEENDNDR